MTIKVGINGMGRIGRMVLRSIFESQNKNLKINHINNRSNSETTCQLIKYDSIHGKFNTDIKLELSNFKFLITSNESISVSYEKEIMNFEQLIKYLKEKNLEILDISIDEGDLEDVFLQLTKE